MKASRKQWRLHMYTWEDEDEQGWWYYHIRVNLEVELCYLWVFMLSLVAYLFPYLYSNFTLRTLWFIVYTSLKQCFRWLYGWIAGMQSRHDLLHQDEVDWPWAHDDLRTRLGSRQTQKKWRSWCAVRLRTYIGHQPCLSLLKLYVQAVRFVTV